jgi:excinuclease ABC subunit B
VSLVAILDADKEGFLRSAGALIQTSGRAARNINGRVIMYADTVTDSMRTAIGETHRRRAIQEAYNVEHGITPQSIVKEIDAVMSSVYERDYLTPDVATSPLDAFHTQAEIDAYIASLQDAMRAAAANMDFEKAAAIRDEIKRARNPELSLTRSAGRA